MSICLKTRLSENEELYKKYTVMDGNTAAAYAACAFTEVAAIYPTPSFPMAEKVEEWVTKERKVLFALWLM